MYTDKEIANRKTKVHPAIVMPKNWLTVISDDLKDTRHEEFLDWLREKKPIIIEKYGEQALNTFLGIIAPRERNPFLKAGFQLNYSYLDKLIETSTVKENTKFEEQELGKKLIVVRENITLIALAENALWKAAQEYKDRPMQELTNVRKEIVSLTQLTQILISGNSIIDLVYLEDAEKLMQKDSGKEKPPTATFIKSLKKIKDKANQVVSQKESGYIVNPEA